MNFARRLTLCSALAILVLAVPVYGQVQTKQQQKCINAMTKGMVKFLQLGARNGAKCISDAVATGSFGAAYACTASATTGPQGNALNNKLLATFSKVCKPPAPNFGPTQPASVWPGATSQTINKLAQDVFGTAIDIDIGLVPCALNIGQCDCQRRVFKRMTVLVTSMARQFSKCSKAILKGKAPLAAASSLQDVKRCLIDPTVSLSVAGSSTVSRAITRFNALFQPPPPGTNRQQCPISDEFSQGYNGSGLCKDLTGDLLATCLVNTVKCRTCNAINTSYSFGLVCQDWVGFMCGP